MPTRRATLRALAAILGALLVGCGSTAPASPTGQPAPAAKPKLETFKVGIVDCTPLCGFRYTAVDKGYFAAKGLDVQFVQSQNQVNLLKALVAGELDVQETNFSAALRAVAVGGSPLKVIGATNPGLAFVLYARKGIQTPKDLLGKKVGISTPGTLPQILVQLLLRANHLDPNGVQWVPVGDNSQRVQAVVAGKVDATASLFDFEPLVAGNPDVQIPLRFATSLPKFIQTSLITTDAVLKNKHKQLEDFLVAYSQGYRYAIQHPDETTAVAAKVLKQPADAKLRAAIDLYIKYGVLNPDITTPPDAIQYMEDVALQNGEIKTLVPLDKIFDPAPARIVDQTLGPFKP